MELRHIIKQGRSVIPVADDKLPLFAWREYSFTRPTKEDFANWESLQPTKWAVITGDLSGIVTLDFDGRTGEEALRKSGLMPHRRTPNGFHVDFEWRGNELRSGMVEFGVDLKGLNGYVVVLGQGYHWFPDYRPRKTMPRHLRPKRLELPRA